MKSSKLIVVLGPTATGKSDLGVALAQRFNGEVISADSRQVYKGFDIGSGKITKREMKGIPHHMLDVASPRVRYAASRYGKEALRAVKSIITKNKLPIVVGGTGLYIDTIVCGTIFPEVKPNITLRKKLEKMPASALFALLKKKDPKRAALIDPHNTRRLIRALEIVDALGNVPSLAQSTPLYDTLFIGLTVPPEKLRTRIHTRLEKRLKQGMTREVQALRTSGLSWKRLDELGLEYRFVSRYLRGLISKKEMVESLEREIIKYAKRQMTWFKRNKDIAWFAPTEEKKIMSMAQKFLKA
ncbi:MAG: tRNA dimethylallyltransferase [Patescibacteria group bacterium]|jgi:tRNA dimethylallyltransferase|nr:tRNA dimethylallyltransferase [Patescibacteria group bacterium]